MKHRSHTSRVVSLALGLAAITGCRTAGPRSPTVQTLGERLYATSPSRMSESSPDRLRVIARATDDGLVEVTFAGHVGGPREWVPRETQPLKEYYEPREVELWAHTVRRFALDPSRQTTDDEISPTLGSQRGRRAKVRFAPDRATLSLEIEGCSTWSHSYRIAFGELSPTLSVLLDAARAARAVGARPIATTAARWRHAVGCPARPSAANPHPEHPFASPSDLRSSHELLASFVVDTTGVIEPQTISFASGSPPELIRAAERVLAVWRFTPAMRAGRPVRQVAHAPIAFRPSYVSSSTLAHCWAGPHNAVVVHAFRQSDSARTQIDSIATPIAERLIAFDARSSLGVQAWVGSMADGWTVPRSHHDYGLAILTPVLRTIGDAVSRVKVESIATVVTVSFQENCDAPIEAVLRVKRLQFTPTTDGKVRLTSLARDVPPDWWNEVWQATDVVSADDLENTLRQMKALVESPTLDTSSEASSASARPEVRFGHSMSQGVSAMLTRGGWLRGTFGGGPLMSDLEVMPHEFAAVERAAAQAIALARRQTAAPLQRALFEHEVGVPIAVHAANPRPVFPAMSSARDSTSREVLVRFVVDTLGIVERESIEAVGPHDRRFVEAVGAVLPRWRFSPAWLGGRRVRQVTHLAITVAPPELSHTPAAPTLSATAPADRPTAVSTLEAWNAAVRAMQPYVDQARATYPTARQRYLAGLPANTTFFVTVRLTDRSGRMEQVFVAVSRIQRGLISGRIWNDVDVVSGYRRGHWVLVAETEIVDWTITHPDGREEGNVVGKFLDNYRTVNRGVR